MRKIFSSSAAILLPLFIIACGSSIKTAQDFLPNKAPAVTKFAAEYIGTDAAYSPAHLYSGMSFKVTVDAIDPENKGLTYELTSSQGTFSDRTDTSTGAEWTFYIGDIGAGQNVSIKLKVSDIKNAMFIQTLDIGSGKTAPGLTVTPPSDSEITPDGETTLKFSCDSKGSYRVYIDNDITSEEQAVIGTSVTLYQTENTDVLVTIGGPSYTKTSDVQLIKDVVNRIWIVFQDNLTLKSAAECVMYVEGTVPRVISSSPNDGDTNMSCLSAITVQFSKAINTSTLIDTNILLKSSAGSVPVIIGSYDTASNSVKITPAAPLSNSTLYTVTLANAISDTVPPTGNKMIKDYVFSFTTVPAGMIPNTDFTPSGGTYSGAQTVSLASSETGTTIIYTTDGSEPSVTLLADGSFEKSVNSQIYTSPFQVSVNATVKSLSYKTGSVPSAVSTAKYFIRAEPPVFEESAVNTKTNALTLTFKTATPDAYIKYTTDNSEPASGVSLLSGQSISVNKSMKVRAVTVKNGLTDSPETSKQYTVSATPPVFTPSSGTLNQAASIQIAHDANALVYYTMTSDGSEPANPDSTNWTVYGWGIDIAGTPGSKVIYTIKAVAAENIKSVSAPVTAQYIIDRSAVGTLLFSLDAGEYSTPEDVAISCSASDAIISCTASVGTTLLATYSGIGSVTVPVTKSMTLTATASKGSMTEVTLKRDYTLKLSKPSVAALKGTSGLVNYIVSSPYADNIYYSVNSGTILKVNSFDIILASPGDSVTLYAARNGWTNSDSQTFQYFLLSYNSNGATGGSIPYEDTLFLKNGSTSIPGNDGSLVKQGYSFAGWNTSSSATTVLSGQLTITSNVTLYAVWKATGNDITSFSFTKSNNSSTLSYDAVGTIVDTNVFVNFISGTSNTRTLVPSISLSAGATISPDPAISQDFTIPVSYIVTSAQGVSKTFTITVNTPTKYNSKTIYSSTGSYVLTIASSARVFIKAWGAGGSSYQSSSYGGCGGYSYSEFYANGGDSLYVVVGSGGLISGTGLSSDTVATVPAHGGNKGGGGGSLVALYSSGTYNLKCVAGGGGGGNGGYNAGVGGGVQGGGAWFGCTGGSNGVGGSGGTEGSPVAGTNMPLQVTTFADFKGYGANSNGDAGGGGGGFGGGGASAVSGRGYFGAGGGGYAQRYGTVTTSTDSFTGTPTVPPNSTDSDYITGKAIGGKTGNGGDGLVVVYVLNL